MGWPAADFKRATVYYRDAQGRTVNTAAPTGGVATEEYNETNDVTRTLSADARAEALKETGKTSETAERLDTKSLYADGGAELVETLGPEHKVKLASGAEILARNHVRNYYDEGAPAEYSNDTLVTKSTDSALYAGKEEDVRTHVTAYAGQSNLGWKLRKPTSVTTDPGGLNLTSVTKYNETTGEVIETQSPAVAGKNATVPPTYSSAFGSSGTGSGQFKLPTADAVDASGNVWVVDTENNRVEKFTTTGAFVQAMGFGVTDGAAKYEICTTTCKAGTAGAGSGQFSSPSGIAINQTSGNVYITDQGNNRVEEFSSAGTFIRAFATTGSAAGQLNTPAASAVDGSGNVWIADTGNNRVTEYNPEGAFLLAAGWGVKDGKSEAETCTTTCQAGSAGAGSGQFANVQAVAISGGNVYVVDRGNDRIEKFSAAGAYQSQFGTKGIGPGQFTSPFGIATEPSTGDLYVSDKEANRLEKFTPTGGYLASFGATGAGNGQFSAPRGIALTATSTMYIADSANNRIDKWLPTITGNEAAHDSKTIYYSSEAEAEIAACQNHPEWAGLPCETAPVAQPGTSGLPELPVTTMTYNVWDEVEVATEKFGTTTRTKTETYDSAGRALTSEETSTTDAPLPKVTNEYSTTTGAVIKQSTTLEGKTKSITSVQNTLGQRTSYTDADGSTATYKDDIDGRIEEMSDGKGTQIYAYDATTGMLTKLLDSAAGTFTATYDVEGHMITQTYPNGMTAYYGLNSVGQTIGLEYKKTTHCTEKCVWFSDAESPSIHGEILSQTTTLAKDNYVYDKADRLIQAQEEPAGKGCMTRIYGYDEEADRTSLTTREPGAEGKCATEGGATTSHVYDTANRLTDPGVTYEALGNTTKVPAADAGGNELTSSYFVDGQVASQTQNGETMAYQYDPSGRTRETVATGKVAATTVLHYSEPGDGVSWTNEGSQWTRNIPGIDGGLDAVTTSTGSTTLELHDLQGNIVATASASETEVKLLSTYNSTEFGVPASGTIPPKYAWLGATGVSTVPAFESGITTRGGSAYVPQLARSLQTEAVVPPGAFPNGDGTGSPYTATVSAASLASAQADATRIFEEEEAARQKAAAEKAEHEHQECVERGECLQAEDPPEVFYFDQTASLVIYAAMGAGSGVLGAIQSLGFLSGLSDKLLKTAANFIIGHFTFEVAENWIANVDHKLGRCVNAMSIAEGTDKESNPTCRVELETIHVGEFDLPFAGTHYLFSVPNVTDEAKVSYCKYGHTWCYAK